MQLRIFTEPQEGASYDTLLRIAKLTEDSGFDAFFRSDHYQAIMGGDGLPGPTDAWITLAGLARETSRIRLGTLVSPATFRLPGPLAISVAQVDAMSGGRVELGFGTGWYDGEHSSYGIPFPPVRERFDRYEEQMRIITGLWAAEGPFSFKGAYYEVTDSPALPKPVQRPGPPIIVGGFGARRTPAIAAAFAAEYNVPFRTVEETAAAHERVRSLAGRPLVYSAAQAVCVGRTDAEVARRAEAIGNSVANLKESGLAGSPAEVLEKIKRFGDRGTTRLYLQVLDLSDLDHIELIAEEILPHV
ncbi:LLM class F420-dependent oxidoreductase [Actinocorallia longicatena]|uniref:LLM class F420-dependent oxidoreductase n=1 Tax=Actinocorallia longicatena TaxID=111803 RepID=A0ABP6QG62_9ACTN